MSQVDELYEDFGLSKPSVEINQTPEAPGPANQQLTEFILELNGILAELERLKRTARSPQDWQAVMMYLAGQKPRVSEMTARAKRLYAQQFGDAFDRAYQPAGQGQPRGTGTSIKTAEIQAKAEAGLAYEAADRLERTWRDLQDMMWACKSVAESQQGEKNATPSFEAFPDHLFGSGS